jgi:hypothetical protein
MKRERRDGSAAQLPDAALDEACTNTSKGFRVALLGLQRHAGEGMVMDTA